MAGRLVAAFAVVALLGVVIVHVDGNAGAGTAGSSPGATGGGIGTEISLPEAEQIALKTYPGAILKSKREHDLYEIIIKTSDGKVVKLKVDPADGSIVSFREKRKHKD